jgi:hypothetical protein
MEIQEFDQFWDYVVSEYQVMSYRLMQLGRQYVKNLFYFFSLYNIDSHVWTRANGSKIFHKNIKLAALV